MPAIINRIPPMIILGWIASLIIRIAKIIEVKGAMMLIVKAVISASIFSSARLKNRYARAVEIIPRVIMCGRADATPSIP